jgi:hypothetical protein
MDDRVVNRLVERDDSFNVGEQEDAPDEAALRRDDMQLLLCRNHAVGDLEDEMDAAAVQVRGPGEIEDEPRRGVRHGPHQLGAQCPHVGDINLAVNRDDRHAFALADPDICQRAHILKVFPTAGTVKPALGLDESLPHRVAHQQAAVVEVEFLHDVRPVGLDGLHADKQPVGDL